MQVDQDFFELQQKWRRVKPNLYWDLWFGKLNWTAWGSHFRDHDSAGWVGLEELRKREHEIRAQRLANPEQVHLPIQKEIVMKRQFWFSYAIGLN